MSVIILTFLELPRSTLSIIDRKESALFLNDNNYYF